MVCGIYKLVFIGTDKVYIGQSTNIVQKFNVHKHSMLNNTCSHKLRKAYEEYGLPILEILEECNENSLNDYETEIIEIYNSVNEGFNTLSSASDIPRSVGDSNGRAKFTNEQIEQSFNLLVNNPSITFTEVEKITGVGSRSVKKIANGENHSWLASKYPNEYKVLLSLVGTRKSHSRARNTLRGSVTSPTGEVFPVYNAKEFAKTHSLLHSSVCKVLVGTQKTHKGWKLYNE